jgi:L-methionine (R)-S-oxide reductase
MFEAKAIESDDKVTLYRELTQQLNGLLSDERDAIANAANTAALLFTGVPDLNSAGFYFLRSPKELVLGPFRACRNASAALSVAASVARRSSDDGPCWSRMCTLSPTTSPATPPLARS